MVRRFGILLLLFPLSPGGWCPRMYCSHAGLLYEPDFESSHLHRQAPPRQRRREKERGNYVREMAGNFAEKWRVPRHLKGSFTCRKSATWDRRLYFPSEGRHAEDLFVLKNPTASAGFEPAKSDIRGQHATPRPPKLLGS
jgi:hypothetical protein